MKFIKLLAFLLPFSLFLTAFSPVYAAFDSDMPSCILIEAESGKVLYEKNADEMRHPASVTKVMTMLLVFEALDSGRIRLHDSVTVSERAAQMGGSQVFLEVGEVMTVEDLLKSVIIASANDAAVALGEYIAGSESAFVDLMNQKAIALGMKNTHFDNTNGLDDTTETHLTTARDIALMSKELLIRHPSVKNYTTIWQDSIRGGAFVLTNTNKLVRFYRGATGLKTGFTRKSGYCMAASAERDGLSLVAVVMGAETSDKRNVALKEMLDYGFASFQKKTVSAPDAVTFTLTGGRTPTGQAKGGGFSYLSDKGSVGEITVKVTLKEGLAAPIHEGDAVGEIVYQSGETVLYKEELKSCESIPKMSFFDMLLASLKVYFYMT